MNKRIFIMLDMIAIPLEQTPSFSFLIPVINKTNMSAVRTFSRERQWRFLI
jgi:hypothetical protein